MSSEVAERRLAEIASRQHGAFTREQALGAGFSAKTIRSRVGTSTWRAYAPQVYAHRSSAASWEQRLSAALLAGGPRAAASHNSAAFLHALSDVRAAEIEITIPRARNIHVDGVRIHRVNVEDTLVRASFRVTTVPRTIVDLASTAQLMATLDTAIDRRMTTVARMQAYVAPLRTNAGLRRLRQVLDDREKGSLTTELERRFDALVNRFGLPLPTRQHPIGSRLADFAYVDERIVIELDGGESHMRKEVFEDDRGRQNEMILRGWTVLRFTWDDITKRPERVVATIRQTLAMSSRKREGARPPDAASPYGG